MMASLRNAISGLGRERFVRHVVTLGGGTGVGQLLVAASYPIITRLYGPSTLGIYGMIASFAYVASTALGGKYELAIVSVPCEREATVLTLISLSIAIPVALVAALAMQVFVYKGVLSYALVPRWASILLAPILILTGWFTALRFWCVRQANFGQVSRALVAQGLGRMAIPVALGFVSASVGALLAGELFGRLFAVRGLFKKFWPRARVRTGEPMGPNVLAVMRSHWRCPGLLLPSSLIDALGAALPLPIIATFFGPVAAGQFALVQRVVSLPAAFITSSVSDVVHSHASLAHATNPGGLKQEMIHAARRLAIMSALVYVPLAILSPFLFGPIFGANWALAGVLASWLAPLLAMHTVVSPLTRIFLVVRRYDLKLLCDVANCLLPILVIVLVHGRGLVVTIAAFGITAMLVSVGVYATVYHVVSVHPISIAVGKP
jgi:O-antigen/teichoic acid export membrane protein